MINPYLCVSSQFKILSSSFGGITLVVEPYLFQILVKLQQILLCNIQEFNRTINSYRERLHTDKVFTKDQSFYLNYHKFSIKSYVLDVY